MGVDQFQSSEKEKDYVIVPAECTQSEMQSKRQTGRPGF
jgi:hypothetical protein